MPTKEFSWANTEYRGAAPYVVKEAGHPFVLHAAAHFDDRRRIVWVGVWWTPDCSDEQRQSVLRACVVALNRWRGLQGYEPRVVQARRPFPPGPVLGSSAYIRKYDRMRK